MRRGVGDGMRIMRLRIWPESSRGWSRAQRSDVGWGRGDVVRGASERLDGRGCSGSKQAAAQSSKSAGNDGAKIKSGMDSAWVRSKAGVWSRRKSPWGGPRAGEIGGGAWGSSRCSRMAKTTGGSVRKGAALRTRCPHGSTVCCPPCGAARISTYVVAIKSSLREPLACHGTPCRGAPPRFRADSRRLVDLF